MPGETPQHLRRLPIVQYRITGFVTGDDYGMQATVQLLSNVVKHTTGMILTIEEIGPIYQEGPAR